MQAGKKNSTVSTVLQCATLKKYLPERSEVAYQQRNNFSDLLMDLTSMRKKSEQCGRVEHDMREDMYSSLMH